MLFSELFFLVCFFDCPHYLVHIQLERVFDGVKYVWLSSLYERPEL